MFRFWERPFPIANTTGQYTRQLLVRCPVNSGGGNGTRVLVVLASFGGPSGIVSFVVDDTPMSAKAFDPVTGERFEVAAGGVILVWLNLHDYRFIVIDVDAQLIR